jgi:hypothetical protein
MASGGFSAGFSALARNAKAGTSLQQVQFAIVDVQTKASFETLPSFIMVCTVARGKGPWPFP